jgi:hypothetical protein
MRSAMAWRACRAGATSPATWPATGPADADYSAVWTSPSQDQRGMPNPAGTSSADT